MLEGRGPLMQLILFVFIGLSAGALAGLVALVVGVPMFRLTEHSFAMGTLGFAIVTQIVATNWVDFTHGPLCVTGIPKPQWGAVRIATLPAFYWMGLTTVALVGLLYHGLTTFRLGRAFHAVRDNEMLAAAASIDPLRYRMLAFIISGAVAGGVGAPVLFGWIIGTGSITALFMGYLVAAALMIFGALIEAWIGVPAERRSLEHVAAPRATRLRAGRIFLHAPLSRRR